MKKVAFLLLFLLPFLLHAQSDDTSRYSKYPNTYGFQYPRIWATTVLRVPTDTIYSKSGVAILNGKLAFGNGSYWQFAESLSNKVISIVTPNNTDYPTTSAVNCFVASSIAGKVNYTDSNTVYQTKFRSDTARYNVDTALTNKQPYNANTTLLGNTTTGSGGIIVLSGSPTLTLPSIAAIGVSGGIAALPTGSGTLMYRGDSSIFQPKFRSDTARYNVDTALANKQPLGNYANADSTVWQTKFRSDTARINTYSDIQANKDSISAKSNYSKGLTVYGNSISAGTGATVVTNGYAFILARQIGGQFLNYANSGDQVADLTYRWQFPTSNPIGGGADPTTISEIGTNDVTQYGSNVNKQTIFKRCELASLSWAGLPLASKKLGQAFTLSGFAATDSIQKGLAIKSTTNGNTATTTITTQASSYIYVWYLIRDGNLGSFTFSIDGTLQTDNYNGTTTIYNYGDNGATIATQNGYTSAIACNRFAVSSAGSHTVVITNNSTTGQNVTILGIGTNPATSSLNPTVISVTPNHQNNANDSLSGVYSQFVTNTVTTLQGDGLNIILANTRSALGTNYATYYADAIHPNNAGHAKMDSVIIATVPTLNVGSVIPNPYVPQSVYQYTQPINPTQFWSPNAGNLTTSNYLSPGINWFKQSGNQFFTAYTPTLGVYNGFANAGGVPAVSFGAYPQAQSGYSNVLVPAITSIYFSIYSDGRVIMFPNGSGGSNTAYFGNNLVSFGTYASVGNNTFTTSFANNYINTSSSATSGTNQNSPTLYWSCAKWNGSSSVRDDAGFFYKPNSGTNPDGYLKLFRGNQVGSTLFALDLTSATLANKLGFVQITTNAAGVAGTDSIVVKSSSNGDLRAVSPTAFLTNPLTTTGDLIYSSSGSTASRLPIGSTGQILSVSGGVPTWSTISTGGTVTSVSTTNGLGISSSVASSTTTPNITIAVDTSNSTILSQQRAANTYQTSLANGYNGSLAINNGTIFLRGNVGSNGVNLARPSLTANRTATLQDKDGTVAYTSDLPTSGTYTPTLTNTTNVSSSSLSNAYYSQIGNIVHVAIALTITPTLVGGTTQIDITLPVNSSLSTGGAGNIIGSSATNATGFTILKSTSTMRATFFSTINTSSSYYIQFDYSL